MSIYIIPHVGSILMFVECYTLEALLLALEYLELPRESLCLPCPKGRRPSKTNGREGLLLDLFKSEKEGKYSYYPPLSANQIWIQIKITLIFHVLSYIVRC